MSSDDFDPWESDDLSPQDEYDRMTSAAEANDAYEEWKSGNQHRNSNSDSNRNTHDGCFIATAAYGSPLEVEVITLKQFRDSILIKYKYGRYFVNAYYAISPPIAEYLNKNHFAKRTIRILLKPVVVVTNHINSFKSVADSTNKYI